ncbi:MAG: MFS transporter [Planctomycetaceae bacterium]|nr:MFS transporter [Planctomycetaceae bacterium]
MSESESAASDVAQADRRESFNMRILATQLIIMRVGWIFKTESVIIPAVLDVISGAAWVRGLLPVLNRLGQSLPPMLLADTIRGVRLKKRALIFTTLGMALPFLTLASVWRMLDNRQQPWLVILFLVLYLVFFSATGLNQLVDGTLQGKLIRPTHRGRLMGRAGMLGSLGAVLAALFLLRPWLALPNHDGFAYIFLFNGSAYFIAGLMANLCQEAPDDSTSVTRKPWWSAFRAAWEVVRDDGRFRRAATVSILFMMGLLLFPHYQWLAREQLGSTHGDLIWWVIAQNISVGVLSPIVGRLADRFGNRLALRVAAFLSALTPAIAVILASPHFPLGRGWFWITYVFLGLTPVTMRTISNYTLELVPREQHPRYLSTMTVCYTLPFVISPLFGSLLDVVPYQYPFLAISGVILLSALLTFRMAEPRHDGDATA